MTNAGPASVSASTSASTSRTSARRTSGSPCIGGWPRPGTRRSLASALDEAVDRYGPLHPSLLHLAEYGRIRILAGRLGVESLERAGARLVVKFRTDAGIDPSRLVALVNERPAATLLPPAVLELDLAAGEEREPAGRPGRRRGGASWWTTPARRRAASRPASRSTRCWPRPARAWEAGLAFLTRISGLLDELSGRRLTPRGLRRRAAQAPARIGWAPSGAARRRLVDYDEGRVERRTGARSHAEIRQRNVSRPRRRADRVRGRGNRPGAGAPRRRHPGERERHRPAAHTRESQRGHHHPDRSGEPAGRGIAAGELRAGRPTPCCGASWSR